MEVASITRRLPFSKEQIETSIVARWQEIVRSFPDASAIVRVDGQLHNYQQVDCAAKSLAGDLVDRLGVSNSPVGLLLDHKPNILIAILGALHANKAYVALDPTQPVAQLQMLHKTIGSPLIITDTARCQLAETLAEHTVPICNLDQIPDTHVPGQSVNISPDAMAGIFFTSGTTRLPRGIVRSHRTIMHRIWCNSQQIACGPGQRISGLFQCGLGGGVADVFNALLNGAAYCVYHFQSQGLVGFSTWLREQQINSLRLPVVLFRRWMDSLSPGDYFPHLEHVIPSGPKTRSDVQRLWPHVSDACQLWTGYSATETTQVSCSPLNRYSALESGSLHVGKPLPDKSVAILKDDGSPAATGEIGQIVVRSRYIAREYWQQPELSRQRFRLAEDGLEMIFATGDYGRQRSDGNLDVVGRRDSQIKVRGYRLVLNEVEDALRELPEICESAVVWDAPGARLVAYVVAASDPPATSSAIRKRLANYLPDYAIPAKIIYVGEFPLLASGKIDRGKLSPADRQRPQLDSHLVPPRTAVEAQLARLWSELLDIDPIGVHDSFFELGGDSLLTARLLMEVERTHGARLPIASFFGQPTIAHLASLIGALSLTNTSLLNPLSSRCAAAFSQVDEHSTQHTFHTLDSFHDVLEHPCHIAIRKRSAADANWNRRSQFLNLCMQGLGMEATTRLLAHVTHSPSWRRRLFGDKQLKLRQFLERIDSGVDIETTIASNLYFYLVDRYRVGAGHAGSQSGTRRVIRQTQLEGLHDVRALCKSGRGVILVRSHDYASSWFRELKLADYRVGGIRHVLRRLQRRTALDEQALFAQQLSQARERLLRGQIVEIHGDGYDGTSPGIEHQFHGVQRRFLAGFAELAVLSQAAVFVVECSLQQPLRACVRLRGPLDSGAVDMDYKDRVGLLVEQYVHSLREMWATRPWLVPLSEIESYFSACPVAQRSAAESSA